jgi:hypothetical protein
MKFKKFILIILFCLISLSIGIHNLFAYGEYNTPDSWGLHTTPGGFKDSYEGIRLGNTAIMDMNLTTRYRIRANEYSDDQDLYQYVRGSIKGFKLGNGTVEASYFLRFADDIDGTDREHFFDDSLDLGLDGGNWDTRFYHGEISFDNVISNTKIVMGRQYVSHLETVQIDGLDVVYDINDKFTIYGFSGGAVSYFDDWDDDWIHGGGFEFRPFNGTKIRAEYIRANVEDFSDDIVNVRVDQVVPYGNVYTQFGNLDNAQSLEAGGNFTLPKFGTIFNLKYEGVYDEISDKNSYVENPLTYALLPYGKYNLFNISAYQGFLEHYMLGAGVEHRNANGNNDFFNRDYTKFFTSFDIMGLPTDGTYISLFVEKWDTEDNKESDDEQKLQVGGSITQQITPELDIYAGTKYDRYKYDFVEFDYGDVTLARGRKRESIRTYYFGGKWEPNKRISLIVDCNIENSDVFDDDDFKNNYTVEAWLNIAL